MINKKKVLAIIPARGGSKSLPGKNIKMIAGKALIAWTIDEAKKSKYIDKTIVSTDSSKIAEIAKKFGAEVPFIRPAELATDTAKSTDVIKHAVEFFKKEFEIVILLQPTSPLRNSEDIDNAFGYFEQKNAKAVVSVSELEHPIQWVGKLQKDKNMANFTSEIYKNKNRQELEKYYRYNGAIYISEIGYFLDKNGFIGKDTFAFIMKRENSFDVDTYLDFKIAEYLLKERL